MAGRNLTEPIIFTGGVAMVPGMEAALQSALGKPVLLAPDPQMTCALGAAILAAHRVRGRHPPAC
jgi:activator of 2-hydroxyglutaryl-CoA dehydratase